MKHMRIKIDKLKRQKKQAIRSNQISRKIFNIIKVCCMLIWLITQKFQQHLWLHVCLNQELVTGVMPIFVNQEPCFLAIKQAKICFEV